ncbi:hypothetical protein [Lysinibacillus sp. LZ02]|uniref:hypothetical protein n=1 Tax=Lysinibacillus sp. LZ02 TaxID=3420668 RepID=UPI003D35A72E
MVRKSSFVGILLLCFAVGVFVGRFSSSSESQPRPIQEASPAFETSTSDSLDNDVQERLSETLNLSFRIISAMLHQDIDYLQAISDPSVQIDAENNVFFFSDYGENGYEHPFSHTFDYDHVEYRGHQFEENTVLVFLGVYNASYVFEFVEGKSQYGNYLFKSLVTN